MKRFERPLPKESAEFRTDHRIVGWDIAGKAERWMRSSHQVILIVGNMPEPRGKVRRYVDSKGNFEAQRAKIDAKMREWVGSREEGELTAALCSGSRGVDLEAYNTIRKLREERPLLKINVISILPVNKDEFRDISVKQSYQEPYWVDLYNKLLTDPNAIVHEPHFRSLDMRDFLQRGGRKRVTEAAAIERSNLLNGNTNDYRVYSDVQQELVRLTESAYRSSPQRKKSLHMLLVTDGGRANGDGGTNELVARFYNVFGEDIEKRRRLRNLNLRLASEAHPDGKAGFEALASSFETICVIQDGMILDQGRRLVSPLEERGKGKNGEYIDTVIEAYAEKFGLEKHDNLLARRRTMRARQAERRRAAQIRTQVQGE